MKQINAIFMISIMLVLTFGTITISAEPKGRVESEIQTGLTVNCETLHQRTLNLRDIYYYSVVENAPQEEQDAAWDNFKAAHDDEKAAGCFID